jgi:FixJ family two-component response regulator
MMKKIIWLIDENENELRTYTRKLKRMMPDSVQINPVFPPYRKKEEYISVLNDPDTACIIIDQRLKDTGIATYTGIELAQYLRSINQKIPIYILTNYAEAEDEFAGGKWSVEDVIPKDALNNEEQLHTVEARIRRHINIYEDILNARAKRFNELLKKSLTLGLHGTLKTA